MIQKRDLLRDVASGKRLPMENLHAINEELNYFDWAMFNSNINLPEGSCPLVIKHGWLDNPLSMKVSRKITDFYGPFSSQPCFNWGFPAMRVPHLWKTP